MIGNVLIKFVGPLFKLMLPKLDEKLRDARQDIIEHIFKVGKLEENTRYRELPNEADMKIEKLEEQIKMMAEEAGEVKDIITKLTNKSAFRKLFK